MKIVIPPSLDIFPIFQNIILSDSWNNSLTEGSEVSQNFPSVDRKPVWEYETGHKWSSSKSLSIHVLHQQLGALMWHIACRHLYQCLMPDYARRCWSSTLIPINQFLAKFRPTKKKYTHFCSSKIDRVRGISRKSLKFSIVNISNGNHNCLNQYHGHHECLW